MPLIIRKGLDGAKGATGAQGPGMVIKSLKLDYSSNLSTMVAANPTDAVSVAIDVSGTLAADTLTILSNIHVIWLSGCVWTIPTGATLNIDGSFEAGLYQVFNCLGTGKVVFGTKAVSEVRPEWFGAVGDGIADDRIPLQAAIDSLTSGLVILGNSKTYLLDSFSSTY
jgi:hypothetical protein